MAEEFDLFLGIQKSSRIEFISPLTWGGTKADERVARKGIIKAPGLIYVEPGTSPSQQTWNAWNIASSISGYKVLAQSTSGTSDLTTVTAAFSTPPLLTLDLEEFATAQNDLEGKQVRNSTMGFQISVKHTNSGAERSVKFFTKVYHRTSGGTETLLHTQETEVALNIAEDVFHQYAFDVLLNTQFFEDERLVIKCSAEDKGIPA